MDSSSPLTLRWSAYTDIGRVRKNNEDSFLGLSLDAIEVQYLGKIGDASDISKDYVFAVSDGMGGAMAGEFASRIAVEKITKMFPPYLARVENSILTPSISGNDSFYQFLIELFHEIHRALLFLSASYEECCGMGTTLTMCWVRPGRLFFGHIGDSRFYHLPKEGGIKQISEDDTHVGWLFRQGKMSEYELKNHPRRNLLQKVLGADHQFVTPQVGRVDYCLGDRFLLCSDGVTDGIFDAQLLEILTESTKKSPAQHLVEEAVDRSGRDNATAMVIEIGAA
ncbi:MAG: protein phosphatase 2C domain-containing protein [Chthoniobacterales bacterium]|nr:protein phosphatase 2C domain-containing protein [Chthoniobacterales bacterium]